MLQDSHLSITPTRTMSLRFVPTNIVWIVTMLVFLQKNILLVTGQGEVVCYVCGGDPNAVMNNPDALVPLNFLNQPTQQVKCSEIYDAGLQSLLFQNECDAAIADPLVQNTCACSNASGPPVATPSVTAAPGGTPAPVIGTPAPVIGTPAPVIGTPAPVIGTPAPVIGTPAPIITTPAPISVSTLVPTVTPGAATPAPVIPTPPVGPPPTQVAPSVRAPEASSQRVPDTQRLLQVTADTQRQRQR